MAKVQSLHGTTPAEIFESGIENIADIQGVALSVLRADGSISVGWSDVDVGTLARMVLILDEAQRRRTIPPEED